MTGDGLRALHDFTDRLAAEDAEAARLLDTLLESQYLFTHANIARKRRFHTGGVVRLLTITSREECVRVPRFALILAETAGLIAEALPDDYYRAAAVNELRGTAWIEYATACRYLARFENGFDGLNRAERAYRRLLDPGTQLAVVDLARAGLLWEQECYDDALRFCRSAADRFSKRREMDRYIEASEVEAAILHRMGDVHAASETYTKVFELADAIPDPEMKARAARNLAVVHRDRGDMGSASKYLLIALQLYETMGHRAMVAQTRWCIASISLIAGNAADAAQRLPTLISNLTELGMAADAARAQLDLAEALLVLDRSDASRYRRTWALYSLLIVLRVRQAVRSEAVRNGKNRRHADRRRYEQIIEQYLSECFAHRTAARVSELAALLTAARPYLSRIISQLFGKPLHRLLRERQVEEACRLLRVTHLPVTEIAAASAFGTDATFYRSFRAALGVTPSEYRLQLAGAPQRRKGHPAKKVTK